MHDDIIDNYKTPPRPNNIILDGVYAYIEPLDAAKHASDLYEANRTDTTNINWRYLPYGPFDNLADYTAWLQQQQERDDPLFFTIIDKKTYKAVGVASYLRINPNDGSIEVGHIHYSPLLQQTMAGTEAMFLMMQWAFDHGYRRYEWKCNACNIRSRRAANRLGLSYEGVFRQMSIVKGRNRNTAWFAAIDKEWPALKQCFNTYLAPSNTDHNGVTTQSLSVLTRPLLYKIDTLELSE